MSEELDENETSLLSAMSVDDTAQAPLTEYRAHAGQKLAQNAKLARMIDVVEALKTVFDPEIPINIYDLGLIYRIDQQADGNLNIDMTLTAPGCPVAGVMPQQVADTAASVKGVGKVDVRVVWEPVWTVDRLSDDAKEMLEMF